MTINEDFQYCVKKFGTPMDGEAVPSAVLEEYKSKVPQPMIDFWTAYGTGLWLNGKFQLCRPDRYQGLLKIILKDDPDFPSNECCLLGFSAFGDLLIWNNKNYALTVELVYKIADTQHLSPKCRVLPPDRAIGSKLSFVDGSGYDLYDGAEQSKPLFDRTLKKLGKLNYGECYGFVPAVGIGGLGVLSEVKKMRALEHFGLIAQLDNIKLRYMDTEKTNRRY
jgi:hypothetical protein